MALRMDLAYRTFPLSTNDRWNLLDAGRVSAPGCPRPITAPEFDLVHCMVEHCSRVDHDDSIVCRSAEPWSPRWGCSRTLHRGRSTHCFGAPACGVTRSLHQASYSPPGAWALRPLEKDVTG